MSDQRVMEAAESIASLARDMAYTFDSAAQQITHVANPGDIHTIPDLMHQVERIQRVLQDVQTDLAPERIPRRLAEALQ